MDLQVFGERLSVTLLEQNDQLRLLTGFKQARALVDAFDVEELVLADGFCCQIAVLEYTTLTMPGCLQEVYVVDLILEVVGEEA